MARRRTLTWLAAALAVAVPLTVAAQRGGFGGRGGGRNQINLANADYDGRFTFVRVRYNTGFGRGGRGGGWSADYPAMERNLMMMMSELTSIQPHLDQTNIHDLDDPEMMKFPVAYLSEPGFWYPSDAEVLGLRTYLAKGGFIIIDDFHYAPEWYVFEQAIRRVLPAARIDRLDVSHPVFNAFFSIKSLHIPYPTDPSLFGEFYGIHEDNDPTKRLLAVINYNMDVGDYVEWSGEEFRRYASGPTNEAYKFMINYVVYGMTH